MNEGSGCVIPLFFCKQMENFLNSAVKVSDLFIAESGLDMNSLSTELVEHYRMLGAVQ